MWPAQASPAAHQVPSCSVDSGHLDGFNGTLSKGWTKYIPVTGPSFKVPKEGHPYFGCLELTVPESQIFDSWKGIDHAPELLRPVGKFPKPWAATTRLVIDSYSDKVGGFHTGMVLRFPKVLSGGVPLQLYWGIYRFAGGGPEVIRLEESGVNDLAQVAIPNAQQGPPLDLRVIDVHGKFAFSYRFPAVSSMFARLAYTFTNSTKPQVGLMTKTWFAPMNVETLFDWFDVTKYSA